MTDSTDSPQKKQPKLMPPPSKKGSDAVEPIMNMAVPRYADSTNLTSRNVVGLGEFPTPTDKDLEYIARRMVLGSKALWKFADDCFDKWFDVEAADAIATAIETQNKELDVQGIFKTCFVFAQVWGYGLISLGYEESGTADLKKAPENPTAIKYISPVSKLAVEEIITDKDPTSPTYGQIVMYKIKRVNGESTTVVEMHASRFIHWERPNIYNTPEGESYFYACYNVMLGMENMTYAIPEAMWQNVSPLRQVELPDWISNLSADDQQDAFDNARDYFTDLNIKKTWVTWPGYKFNAYPLDKGIDYEPGLDFLENQISAATINRYLLEGYPAGKITGSEINRDEYYNDIGNTQQHFIEDRLREFYTLLQAIKQIPEGEYEIEWAPLKVLSEEEEATIANTKAGTLLKMATAVKTLIEAGFVVTYDQEEEEFIIDNPEPEPRVSPAAPTMPPFENVEFTSETPPDPQPPEQGAADRLTQREYEQKRKLAVRPNRYAGPFFNGAKQTFIIAENAWREELRKMVRETMQPEGDDQADLQKKITEYAYDFKELEQFLLQEYPDLYAAAGQEAAEILVVNGQRGAAFNPSDKAAQKYLREQANLTFKNTSNAINDKIKAGLSEILNQGLRVSTQAEINNLLRSLDESVVEAFMKYDGNLRAMTRTETQRIVSDATIENYAQNGIAMAEIVVDPTACSQCQPYSGEIMPLEEAQGLIPIHPNCTCLWIPVLPDPTISIEPTQESA